MKNKKKTLLMSIVMVLVIGLIVTGSSFAYFQWSMGYAAGTGVNVTIEHGGITMHIESEQTEFVGLYPTSNCLNKHAYGDALVTIVNNTGTLALPSLKLKVRVLKNGTEELTSDDLKHIHYSVVPIETSKNIFGRPMKGDVVDGYTCANVPSTKSTDKGGLLTNGTGEVTSSFTFQSVATDGSWTHVPKVNDKSSTGVATSVGYLPRQYFTGAAATQSGHNVGDTQAITFKAGTYTTTYQYYRVYVWMDEGYTSTIIGNVVSDPLQNAKIEIMWSEESMIQQVSGESYEQAIAPGYYDESGEYTTWGDLVNNGDITVEGATITNSNRELTGDLVIPEGITEIGEWAFDFSNITSVEIPASVTTIGDYAFMASSLGSITFALGSQLKEIGSNAFEGAYLTSIEIPASVTTIGSDAFYDSSLSSITFEEDSQLTSIGAGVFSHCALNTITFKGTMAQWNAITDGSLWNWNSYVTKVVCSDGEVILEEE